MAYGVTSVFGIDLGTSESRIAVWKDEIVKLIPSNYDTEKHFTPSYVLCADTTTYVGNFAKEKMIYNPENTFFDVKRLIVRGNDGPFAKISKNKWPFPVSAVKGEEYVKVKIRGKTQKYHPERLFFWVLEEMLKDSQEFMGVKVTSAVMAVPTYFNEVQRKQATSKVAALARINILQVIDDCAAAALAYCFKKDLKDPGLVLVYDLGTYTFQVSVLNVKDFNPKIVAHESDIQVGGKYLDEWLMSHCLTLMQQEKRHNLNNDIATLVKLFLACENAKETLSSQDETTIEIKNIGKNYNFTCKISRHHLEEICTDLIDATLDVVEQALAKAGIKRDQIDHVVLVGGSTHIPKLREMVKNYFHLEELDQSIDPQEIVVYGAAVQGGLLHKSMSRDDTGDVRGGSSPTGCCCLRWPRKKSKKKGQYQAVPSHEQSSAEGDIRQETSPETDVPDERSAEAAEGDGNVQLRENRQGQDPAAFHEYTISFMEDPMADGSNTETRPSENTSKDVCDKTVESVNEAKGADISTGQEEITSSNNEVDQSSRIRSESNKGRLPLDVKYTGGVLNIGMDKMRISSNSIKCESREGLLNITLPELIRDSALDEGNRLKKIRDVTCSVDVSGIVDVIAAEILPDRSFSIITENEAEKLRKTNLSEMKKELNRIRETESVRRNRDMAKTELESYVYFVKHELEEESTLSENDKQFMKDECDQMVHFIDESKECGQTEFEAKLEEIKEKFQPLLHPNL